MKYDDSFLHDKKEHAVRELRSFRMQVTVDPAHLHQLVDGSGLTALRLSRKLKEELYPQALSTLRPCRHVWGGAPYLGDNTRPRREYFKQIYAHEDHKVHLILEKLKFEAHFLLEVVTSAEIAGTLDRIAFFALRGGSILNQVATPDRDSQLEALDGGHKEVPPVRGFTDPLALTLMSTVDNAVFHANEHDNPMGNYNVLKELNGLKGGIKMLHQSLEFLGAYLAIPSRPSGTNSSHQHDQVQIITEDDWNSIFGRLGAFKGGEEPSETVIDLWDQIDALNTAWLKFEECHERLEAPLVYASALFLEHYDLDLMVSWFASASVRLQKFNDVRESSIGFRVFTDNMMKYAADNGNNTSPGKAFTQLHQPLTSVAESLEGAYKALTADGVKGSDLRDGASPELGPAILREAYLQTKVRTHSSLC